MVIRVNCRYVIITSTLQKGKQSHFQRFFHYNTGKLVFDVTYVEVIQTKEAGLLPLAVHANLATAKLRARSAPYPGNSYSHHLLS